jgi:tetratricopeptide (TPR) repeat protein
MKRRPLVSPGSIARMLKAGEACWKRRDFQQFFDVVERASRLDPANSDICLALGRAYGLRYDYAAAEGWFEKAFRVAPNPTKALLYAAQKSMQFAQPQLAERYFHRALEHKDIPVDTYAELAELYERLHRHAEARVMVDRALQLDANCALARLVSARLDGRAARLEEAEQCLRPLLKHASETIRVRAGYELGSILDRQGRYDEAMAALREAKSFLQPQATPLLTQLHKLRANLKDLRKDVTSDLFHRWIDSAPVFKMRRRLALLCGYARSGTTLLEQVLDAHPDIVSAEETHIFVDHALEPLRHDLPDEALMLKALEAAHPQALQQSRENYFRELELLLGNPVGGRLVIDKNPALTFLIPAFARVFPEARFLVAMRDPRDVCLSSFMQYHYPLARETAALLTLEGTVDEYVSKMELWLAYAPLIRNPWIEVRYRDVVQDLESVARRVLEFLEVPWDSRVLQFYQHARQKLVHSITYADVKQPIYSRSVGRWRHYRKYLEPYLDRLQPFVQAFGYGN